MHTPKPHAKNAGNLNAQHSYCKRLCYKYLSNSMLAAFTWQSLLPDQTLLLQQPVLINKENCPFFIAAIFRK